MAIEIVDFPIKNGGSFHSYVNVYQRVPSCCFHLLFFICAKFLGVSDLHVTALVLTVATCSDLHVATIDRFFDGT